MDKKYFPAVFSSLYIFLSMADTSSDVEMARGPAFSVEPETLAEFTNSTAKNIACSASGFPAPKIAWVTMDGKAAHDISHIRHVSPNGTLHFSPFSKEHFRQSVHHIVYRCVASNPFGVIVSRDVHVHAVILEDYELSVHDAHVTVGNTAALKCQLPNHLHKYVKVTKWTRELDDEIEEFTVPDENEKFTILPNGDMHIHNVQVEDGNITFTCHTEHRLTKEKKVSTTGGRIIVSGTKDDTGSRGSHFLAPVSGWWV